MTLLPTYPFYSEQIFYAHLLYLLSTCQRQGECLILLLGKMLVVAITTTELSDEIMAINLKQTLLTCILCLNGIHNNICAILNIFTALHRLVLFPNPYQLLVYCITCQSEKVSGGLPI